jgi:hypothetical protein
MVRRAVATNPSWIEYRQMVFSKKYFDTKEKSIILLASFLNRSQIHRTNFPNRNSRLDMATIKAGFSFA